MTSSNTDASEVNAPIRLDRAIAIIRRRWWAIILCVLLTAGAAAGISKLQTKQYTATASLLFNNSSVAQQASGVQAVSQSDPQGQRNTNLALVQLGSTVTADTAKMLNLTTEDVKSSVTASQQGQSNIVSVAATARQPASAAKIANAYARSFISEQRRSDQATVQNAVDLVQQQYTGLSHAQRLTTQGQSLLDHLESLKILKTMQDNVVLAEAATIPKGPSSPKLVRNTVLGFILGMLLGAGIAFLLERFDRRLREPSDIENALGMPILGVIPRGATTPIELDPRAQERFRILRAHLRYFNVDRELRVLLVISAKPAEGKTTISSNLAATAAVMGTRTLLIEADLRKPVLAERLDLRPDVGLGSAIVNRQTLETAIQRVAVRDESHKYAGPPTRTLDVLPAGDIPPNPTELLESHAMETLLAWARENYEFVVIDSTPLALVADAIPLMKVADGVVVVSRIGVSTRDVAEQLRDRLDTLGAPVLGVVVNSVRERGDDNYGYYGYIQGAGPDRGRDAQGAGGRNGSTSGPQPPAARDLSGVTSTSDPPQTPRSSQQSELSPPSAAIHQHEPSRPSAGISLSERDQETDVTVPIGAKTFASAPRPTGNGQVSPHTNHVGHTLEGLSAQPTFRSAIRRLLGKSSSRKGR